MPNGATGDPADKRRIERLKDMLRQSRERNCRLTDEIERLHAAMPHGDPDHARLVARIAILSNTVMELRQQLADARGTYA
jgi:chromosome segregation ATPase